MTYPKVIAYTARLLDTWLPVKIGYAHMPGVSIGITYKGKLVYKKGCGYADVGHHVPATSKTRYRIASISKTFTAVSVLQLVKHGKVHLDDRVVRYLPWFTHPEVTVRQLLSHTAGVFRDGNSPHWVSDEFPTRGALRKSVSKQSFPHENMTRYAYSNFGYAVLGELVRKVSGLPYDEYVKRHILKPLGMRQTTPDFVPGMDGLAQGYSRIIPEGERLLFCHMKTNAYAAATGFVSTVEDLAKYATALSLTKPSRLLSKESKKELFRKQWATGEEEDWYGLGFFIYNLQKRNVVGHGGGFAGFITHFAIDTDNDIGICTLSNTNPSAAVSINLAIFETIYKLYDDSAVGTGKSLADAKKYEGVYRSRWGDKAVVAVHNRLFAFDPQNHSLFKEGAWLTPAGHDQFTIHTKNNFDSPGERARFVMRKGVATQLVWGSTPLERT